MKRTFIIALAALFVTAAHAQQKDSLPAKPDPAKKLMVVDAACGMCQFGMKASDCVLAVRIDGKTYFVDGTSIDDYGDAHAKDGFCNATRKAEVQGEIVNGRFRATYFHLIKPAKDQ